MAAAAGHEIDEEKLAVLNHDVARVAVPVDEGTPVGNGFIQSPQLADLFLAANPRQPRQNRQRTLLCGRELRRIDLNLVHPMHGRCSLSAFGIMRQSKRR